MGLTVHHLETSRSQRILWLLEELGVAYTLRVYPRDPHTHLAPAALQRIHPLGKSPVITDGPTVVAESGAIIEYLVEQYGQHMQGELAHLQPAPGTAGHQACRFWMHFAEGSLMNWLVMQLVFDTIPRQPMPFWVRPIARAISRKVQQQLVAPNVRTALDFMEQHLAQHTWFAGEHLSMADFQMSFAVEAAVARSHSVQAYPFVAAYRERMRARPAYCRALEKGGPVMMATPG